MAPLWRNPLNPLQELNITGCLSEVPVCSCTESGENKHNELEICVLLQGYELVRITETRWNGSHDWSDAMEGCRFFRKGRMGK